MKKKVKQLLWCLSLICLCTLTACKSIIEEDISDKKVIINAPNGTSATSYNQLFWWEKVDGAITYQVQIASPDFTNVQKLLLDTSIASNKIDVTLAAGNYEWRVRAINGSYQSPYSGSTFTITDQNINTIRVRLKSPDNGKPTKSTTLTWYEIPNDSVISYRVQVSKSDSFNPIFKEVNTPITSYALSLTDETTYYWRVKAFSDTDSSLSSVTSYFSYDVTAPDKVTLTSPTNTAVSKPTKGDLVWVKSTDVNATYNVYVIYGTDAEKKFTVSTNSFSYDADINETVTWRVQAFDEAGNIGLASDTWTFKTGTSASRLTK